MSVAIENQKEEQSRLDENRSELDIGGNGKGWSLEQIVYVDL